MYNHFKGRPELTIITGANAPMLWSCQGQVKFGEMWGEKSSQELINFLKTAVPTATCPQEVIAAIPELIANLEAEMPKMFPQDEFNGADWFGLHIVE